MNAKDRVVEAEAFALRDSKGKARGGIRVNEAGGAELTLFSGRGGEAVLLASNPGGPPIVSLGNEKGAKANFAIDPDGTTHVGLTDIAGVPRWRAQSKQAAPRRSSCSRTGSRSS